MKRKPLRVTATLQEKGNHFYIVARIPTVDGSYQQKWLATGLPIAGNKRRAKLLLDQKLLELQAEYERQNRRAGWATSQVGDVPFVEVLDRWMMRKRIEVAASTLEGYQRILVRLRPYFERAGLTTNEVSPSVIEEYMDLLLRDGLSANTVRHHLTLLKTVFNDEIRNGAPLLNPVKCVKPPRMNEFSGSTYSIEQVRLLFDLFEGDPLEDIVHVAVMYGLRRSEIIGLRWQDVDFSANMLHIRHKVGDVKVDGVRQLYRSDDLKTEASRRSFPLADDIRARFERRQQQVKVRQQNPGYDFRDREYIFVDENGCLITPNFVSDHFRHKIEASQLPKIRFHDLRHTCATLLLQQGCSLREIQAFLGHASYITTTRYAHVDGRSKQHALDIMSRAITTEKRG